MNVVCYSGVDSPKVFWGVKKFGGTNMFDFR